MTISSKNIRRRYTRLMRHPDHDNAWRKLGRLNRCSPRNDPKRMEAEDRMSALAKRIDQLREAEWIALYLEQML
jgi:hypothetical protein